MITMIVDLQAFKITMIVDFQARQLQADRVWRAMASHSAAPASSVKTSQLARTTWPGKTGLSWYKTGLSLDKTGFIWIQNWFILR
jgi:hypothetical protein